MYPLVNRLTPLPVMSLSSGSPMTLFISSFHVISSVPIVPTRWTVRTHPDDCHPFIWDLANVGTHRLDVNKPPV